MQLTFLGNTGLRVSELCLGAMTFGTESGWGADEATSRTMFGAFDDAGGNFIDTADAYTNGTSERMLGSFLKGRRDRFVVGTKYTVSSDRTDPNAGGNHRKNMTRSLEGSLDRLGTDYVDLYWVHVWDGFTPIEETVRALDDAVRAGKVLHIGFSDVPAWLVARADAIAELAHFTRPAAIQVEYNLAQREAERELIPMAEALGMSVLDWSPLGGGALSGKLLDSAEPEGYEGRVASGAVPRAFDKYKGDRATVITKELVAAAAELGCTPAQLAIAWLRQRSPAHIPIIGARSLTHLRDNLGAVHIEIPEGVATRLDNISRIDLGFPHDFVRNGWPDWYGDVPSRMDPRVRTVGRRALGLDEVAPLGDRPQP
jgi:aryl-alcohol dehydrogenase-like predicted oxidoreductase